MKPSLKKFSMTLMLAAALSLVIFAAGCSALPGNTSQALQASGLIETTEITVAPELSGRVAEVNAKEGEAVQIGAVLFRLDDTLLQAQRQAKADFVLPVPMGSPINYYGVGFFEGHEGTRRKAVVGRQLGCLTTRSEDRLSRRDWLLD